MGISTGIGRNRLAPLASYGTSDGSLLLRAAGETRETGLVRISANKHAAFWVNRDSDGDARGYAIMRRISTNGGRTWDEPRACYVLPDFLTNSKWLNSGAYGITSSGRMWCLFSVSTGTGGTPSTMTPHAMYSDDPDLITWSTPADISATVNAGGDAWFSFGPGNIVEIQAGPHAGLLVAPSYQREAFSGAPANIPYNKVCVNDGSGWVSGAASDRSVSANEGGSEATLDEIRNPDGSYTGKLYFNSRRVAAGIEDQNVRLHCVIEDPTATNLPVLAEMQDTNSVKVDCQATKGGVCVDSDGSLYVCIPRANDFRRNLLQIWRTNEAHSTTNPKFTALRAVQHGRAGYSDIAVTTPGNFLVMFEGQPNQQLKGAVPSETLEVRRVSKTWLESNPADDPDIMDFQFTEGFDYATANTYGAFIRDHGRFGNHIQGGSVTGWSWDVDLAPGGGNSPFGLHLESAGTGDGIILQSIAGSAGVNELERYGGPWDWRNDSFSEGLYLQIPSGLSNGTYTIQDCREGSTTLRGYTLYITATDGVYSATIAWKNWTATQQTHTLASIPQDSPFTLWLIRDRTAGTVRLRADNGDGVFAGATATTDTQGNVVAGARPHRLGSNSDGTNKLALMISRLVHYRYKAFSDGELFDLGTLPKETVKQLYNYKAPSVTLPATWNNCVRALGTTFDAAWTASVDHYGGFEKGSFPPYSGQGCGAIRCAKNNDVLYRPFNLSRSANWVRTTHAGLMIRQVPTPGCPHISRSNVTGAAAPDAALDYLHNTGNFGICGVFRVNTGTGSPVYILSNRTNGGSVPCTELTYSAANQQLAITLRDTTGAISASAPNSGSSSFLLDRYYFFGVSCSTTNWADGNANRIQFYIAEIIDGVVGTVTKISSATALSFGTDGTAGNMFIGARNAGTPTTAADWLYKNLLFFDRPLVTAEYQEWANLAVFDGITPATGGGRAGGLNLGIGIGL